MNLKSYLRGIGIGMVVTALILHYSSFGKNQISDADIISRAKELGMIENSTLKNPETDVSGNSVSALSVDDIFSLAQKDDDEKNTSISETSDNQKISDDKKEENKPESNIEDAKDSKEDTKQGSKQDDEVTESKVTEANQSQENKVEEKTTNEEGKDKPTASVKDDKEGNKENTKVQDDDTDNKKEDESEKVDDSKKDYISIVISSGDSSYTVAKKVAEAGLVESAARFDEYLCKNDYDKTLTVGTHKVFKGATEEEIGKILTSKADKKN